MTFLNAFMLGGILALGVPLLIHLLHRSRVRVVPWGAMHLLEPVLRVHHRRFRVEQLLLLLLRCAIPVVLALCMAQPVLTYWKSAAGDVPTALAVLLDDSYSMQGGTGATTGFQLAVANVADVGRRLPRGSQMSLVLLGAPRTLLDAPTFDLPHVVRELAKVQAVQGPIRIESGLELATTMLGSSSLADRQLLLISDFQRRDWLGPTGPSRQRLKELATSGTIRPEFVLWKLNRPVRENASVQSLQLSRYLLGVNQELSVRATLRNHGPRAYERLRVHLRVDGEAQELSEVALAPAADATVLFPCSLDRPGWRVVEVELEAADGLPVDNRYLATVSVVERLGVLVVNGDASKQPLRGETDFFEIALQPFAQSGQTLSDLVQARVVEPEEFDRATLEGMRVVVLANVRRLTELQVAGLVRFVESGGGLLVFAGDRLELEWYERVLTGDSALLPMSFTALAGNPVDAGAGTPLVAEHFTHPALELFNDRRNGNLADGRVWSWYQLRLPSTAVAPSQASPQILARLANGDPLIVESARGHGSVIQVATACDADWSNLPMRPFYLPLMQQLVTYLAARWEPVANVQLGQPLVALTDAPADTVWKVTDPAGEEHAVRATPFAGRGQIEFRDAHLPGVYAFVHGDAEPLRFAVSTPREESDLETLTDAQMQQLAEELGAVRVASLTDYSRRDQLRRHGQPIWQPLLWCVVILLFGELLLEHWLAQRDST